MTSRKLFLLIAFVVVSFSFYACSSTEGEEQKVVEKRAVSVEVNELVGTTFIDYIDVVGVVKANQNSKISSDGSGGLVKSIKKDKGQFVKAGDVVLELENEILKANYDAAKAQYDLAQMTFEKQEKIFKDNVNSEFQYLQSKFQRDQAKAGYELAKSNFEKSFIKAPFNGFVNERYINLGELAVPGMPLFELIDDNSLKISAGVPERFADDVKLNQKVELVFPELSIGKLKGNISFISKSLNADNRTFEIEIRISNKDRAIKPEMLSEIRIMTKSYENTVLVPEDVVLKVDDGYIVFTEENGKAVQKKVEIIKRTNGKIAIKNGLTAGERLITIGYQNIVNGENVNIVN